MDAQLPRGRRVHARRHVAWPRLEHRLAHHARSGPGLERYYAPQLIGVGAKWDRLESASDELAFAHLDRPADGHGHEELAHHHGILLEQRLEQANHHVGSLRVADEHHLSTVVVLPHVVEERVLHVGERDLGAALARLFREDVRADGELAIERNVEGADVAEGAGLAAGRVLDRLERFEVGVVVGDEREIHRRVDVEAVDLRRHGRRARDHDARAVGTKLGRPRVGVTDVAADVGAAEPHLVVAVECARVPSERAVKPGRRDGLRRDGACREDEYGRGEATKTTRHEERATLAGGPCVAHAHRDLGMMLPAGAPDLNPFTRLRPSARATPRAWRRRPRRRLRDLRARPA